jgi:hypothetical protein
MNRLPRVDKNLSSQISSAERLTKKALRSIAAVLALAGITMVATSEGEANVTGGIQTGPLDTSGPLILRPPLTGVIGEGFRLAQHSSHRSHSSHSSHRSHASHYSSRY